MDWGKRAAESIAAMCLCASELEECADGNRQQVLCDMISTLATRASNSLKEISLQEVIVEVAHELC